MKIKKPIIKYTEEKKLADCIKDNDYSNIMINGNENNLEITDITFDSAIFNKIDFNNISLNNIDLVDVIFNDCDLSNMNFDHKYLTRVVFNNCKLSGISFIGTKLKDIEINNCNGKYVNFSDTDMENIIIKDSDLSESFFAVLLPIPFTHCFKNNSKSTTFPSLIELKIS